MSKPLLQLEPLRGVTDLMGFLGVIQDPKKYRAIVKELEDLRKDLNTRIEVIGKINQIDSIRSQASADRQVATNELAKSRELIRLSREAWEETSEAERKQLDDRAKTITARDRKGKDLLDSREKELTVREKSAESMMADSIKIKEAAESAKGAADSLFEEYDRKLKIINETLQKVTH